MPISTSDLHIKLSIKTGSAGNASAQADPNLSLGKYISTTDLVDNTLNNLFPDLTGDQNAAGQVDYRCVFVHNAHATLTLQNAVVWLTAQATALAALAIDNVAASAIGSSSAQADSVANSTTAPSAVGAFSSPSSKGAGLSLGNIGPGQCRAVWVRRTAQNSAAVNNDGCTVRVEGDTAA